MILRALRSDDHVGFGEFLESLSWDTRKRYNPHPLTRAYAREICSALTETAPVELRLVLADENARIVAYTLVQFVIPQDEKDRYLDSGIVLDDSKDCRIAPVVADDLQGKGLGTALLKGALAILRSRGRRNVVLFGGTQVSNLRAVRAYEKAGFRATTTFRTGVIDNVDMWVSLDT